MPILVGTEAWHGYDELGKVNVLVCVPGALLPCDSIGPSGTGPGMPPGMQWVELMAQIMELSWLLACCSVQGQESLQWSSSLSMLPLGKNCCLSNWISFWVYIFQSPCNVSSPFWPWKGVCFFICVSSQTSLLSLVQIYCERCDYHFLSMQKDCLLISVNLVVYNSGLGREALCHSCGLCIWIRYVAVMDLVAEGRVPAYL